LSLLDRQVEAFNEGVRTGDWSSLVELFTDDAELEFVGIPVGPFHGRDAIAAACDAWSRDPERRAGELHLEERDGAIARLRVLYETFS
jgi:ketosteroid isomerase-like protein